MKKWTFAKVEDCPVASLPTIPSLDRLYRDSLQSKEGKKKILNDALNAALENLMSWERVAKAWGFDVEVFTDVGNGRPRPVFEGNTVCFVQAYGVIVHEPEEGAGKCRQGEKSSAPSPASHGTGSCETSGRAK